MEIFSDYLDFCKSRGFATGTLDCSIGLFLTPFFKLTIGKKLPQNLERDQNMW